MISPVRFQIYPGLNNEDGTVSIQSSVHPEYYLRQVDRSVQLHKYSKGDHIFAGDATFIIKHQVSITYPDDDTANRRPYIL